ncbi:DUF1569 domain-containing protein [Mariniflexile ostreae]|uniref:DUF1569 domain-containing protein n=1 Tax=Mariniflexile ostreae TaxID=1520892 RepID=A0ABV5F7G7_9FLAO
MDNTKTAVLTRLLSQIEKHIPLKAEINTNVSKANVGWHIDHTLKVIHRVYTILEKSDPNTYKKNFNLLRSTFFILGWFPRGKVKAPEEVTPPKLILEKDLYAQLQEAKEHLKNIETLHKNTFFVHHIFGMLSKAQTLTFLEMHTTHHLKIMNAILKA